ncbi:MAG: glycosyltransferase family 4 protein [Planctomycetota bacterium]
MKILYHHRTKSRDGQYIHIQALIQAFRRAGHEVRELGLASRPSASLTHESRFWNRFVDLLPRCIMELLEYFYSLPAALWLWTKIRSDRPDLIYERYALGNFAGVLAARWSGIPIFLEVNSPMAEEKRATKQLRFERLARWSERCILKAATRVLAVSHALKEMLVSDGIDTAKIEVIPNGIDSTRLLEGIVENQGFRQRHNLGDSIVIGFVGFFREWHRLDIVLDLLAQDLHDLDLKLMLVGDGPVRDGLARRARDLNLEERVIWTGILEPDQVPEALSVTDIALQAEAPDYACPLKLFDYMAAGRAIVAPRRPNISEILQDNETGLLFEPGNAGEMGNALRRLALDENLRERFGAAARKHLQEMDFTWDANVNRILNLLEND